MSETNIIENAVGNAIQTVGFFCMGVILFYLADSIRQLLKLRARAFALREKNVLKEFSKGRDE